MGRLHRKRQQDREINEKTISALKCHIERHKSQTDTLGEDLSEEFFTSIRVVTEAHISNAQNVLRSINDALSRLTREQTQLKAELENDLAMQATVKTVSHERTKIAAGMAWLTCLE
ncbi:hypothetical protein COL154_013630 [Colletotrichum chrysophilum]|nr:hypothetical protein COL154_013630 [Colletotrichum chrysophilum]